MINCVIIDDEPLAREGLASYVREVDFLQLTGSCTNPLELMTLLDEQPVDLLFLDIQMPKMSGIDFLKIVQNPPMVILTTAYPSFALEGFQLNVLDYLLKPITFERFVKAAHKAREYHRLLNQEPVGQGQAYFFVKCGSKFEKIYVDEILYVESMQNYILIHTTKGNYMTLHSLKSLEEKLSGDAFIRVHKSFLVAISKIDSIDGAKLVIGSNQIPISRRYVDQVMERVLKKNLLDKKE